VNVRRGKYEGTTRVSEREKREKEGLILIREISKKRREGERYPPPQKTAPTEKFRKIEKSLFFASPFPHSQYRLGKMKLLSL
jgi:hypothetical protein